jgi:GrpB-like predicted nucleotidyltransferase (UPF0157 family)
LQVKRTLRLLPYDPRWRTQFESEAARLRDAIGIHASDIEHVGSTAVRGLSGKPVIDIAIAVPNEGAADACIAPIKSLGYEYRGPYGDDPRRRYYVRDSDGVRFAHIHLYIMPATAWHEKLAFRNALRADRTLLDAYAAEKYRVAEEVAWDKAAYSIAKGAFIERVLAALRAKGELK